MGEWRERDLLQAVQKLRTAIQNKEETKSLMERELVDQQDQFNTGLPKLEKLINLGNGGIAIAIHGNEFALNSTN